MSDAPKPAWVHPTALVEEGVTLGAGTRVWDSVHIRRGARIGHDCIVGEKSYVAYDVVIGNYVKLNASVYVCAGVAIEDFCMLSAHTVFTNDRFPRSGNRELSGLETSDPTEETLLTRVRRGVTTGANVTIGPGVDLGEFAMVGMGSVVTRNVPAHALVIGNPARIAGWLSVCGEPLVRAADMESRTKRDLHCHRCGRDYLWDGALTPKKPVVSAS
ncbi:MAG TPA: acyltransferase [Candidatus Polarisedimenticolia bacterium]|nr:acyltransferase [Candidatus Polarisedimenticolia bacterium]